MFSAIYPAFLGSFIFGLLSQRVDWSWGWGFLLAVYFTLLQIEGTISGAKAYPADRCLANFVEIALMVAAFVSFGLVEGAGSEPSLFTIRLHPDWLLPAVFLWPPLFRLANKWRWQDTFGRATGFYVSLTLMSLIATCLAFWHQKWFSMPSVAVILLIYLVYFQIWNESLTSGSFRRPPSEV